MPFIFKQVFIEIESYVSDDCILASNTSSLSITTLAAGMDKSSRFIGLHFFNPAPIMKLVEVIPAVQTNQEVTSLIVFRHGFDEKMYHAYGTRCLPECLICLENGFLKMFLLKMVF